MSTSIFRCSFCFHTHAISVFSDFCRLCTDVTWPVDCTYSPQIAVNRHPSVLQGEKVRAIDWKKSLLQVKSIKINPSQFDLFLQKCNADFRRKLALWKVKTHSLLKSWLIKLYSLAYVYMEVKVWTDQSISLH